MKQVRIHHGCVDRGDHIRISDLFSTGEMKDGIVHVW